MPNEETTVSTSCDDMGGGGATCNMCHYFGYMWSPRQGDPCKSCGRIIKEHPPIPEPYPFGGSDF